MSGRDPDTSTERAEADPRDASADGERIRAIFAYGVQLTGLLSPEGILLEANPAALAFAGLERDEAVGRPLWETLWSTSGAEAPRKRLREAVRHVAHGGTGGTARYEHPAEDAAGAAAVLDVSLSPVPDGEGGVRAIVAEARNITAFRAREHARLAEAEREARLEAEVASRARDDMLRAVAHDLRNPVTGVLMGAKMLRFQLDPDHPGCEILEGIELAAERQAGLIRDLGDVADIEAGRLSIERRPHRVVALLRPAARQFEPLARARGVEFEWEDGADLPLVSADRDRIVQVLANLLDNALQVTVSGGRVKMAVEPSDDAVRFAISDTGPGIPEGDLGRIFERFWRGSNRSSAGTGLGLAIARGIVESHDGEIAVESEVGEGTTLSFHLPVAEDTAS